jgi:hypothetical protein
MRISDKVSDINEAKKYDLTQLYDKESYEKDLLPNKFEYYWEQGLKRYIEEFVKNMSGYNVSRGANDSPVEVKTYFVQSMKQYAEFMQPLRNDMSDIPLISVSISGLPPDYSRYIPHAHNALGYLFEGPISEDGRTMKMKDADYPQDINFKCTVWGKQYSDMFQINYYITKQFHHGGVSYIIVDGKLTRLELKGVSESSQNEAGVSNDRLLRYDYDIDCKAWLREPEWDVPVVWEIPVTTVDSDGNYVEKSNNDLISMELKHGQR